MCPCRKTGPELQPHGSYVGRRHRPTSEQKVGQSKVKAGSEVEGGIGYWLGVTWLMSLSDEDATCTNLLLWGETSTI